MRIAKIKTFTVFIIFLFSCLVSATLPTTQESVGEPEVFQREYILTNSRLHGAVQTYGVYTCVAVVLYDTKNKTGVLAHLDAQVDLERAMTDLLRNLNVSDLEASVLGGQPGDPTQLFEKTLNQLNLRGVRVKTSQQNVRRGAEMSVRLELETGRVSEYRERISNTDPAIASAKIARIKFGTRLFRHQDSIGGGDPVEPVMDGQGPGIHCPHCPN